MKEEARRKATNEWDNKIWEHQAIDRRLSNVNNETLPIQEAIRAIKVEISNIIVKSDSLITIKFIHG